MKIGNPQMNKMPAMAMAMYTGICSRVDKILNPDVVTIYAA